MTPRGTTSVAEALRGDLGRFTRGERRVARTLLADYPRAGLGTAAELATAAGVSAPTVVRFGRSLGFAGYADLHDALLSELSERTASPASQYVHGQTTAASGKDWFENGLDTSLAGIHDSLKAIPQAELDTATALLADQHNRVATFGGRYSGHIARYLALHLQQVRPGVRSLDPVLSVSAGDLIDTGKRDVYVVYDFRRYQRSTTEHARRLVDAGARLICITDPFLSPVAQVADVVLPTSVESASPFDSSAAAFVLTEQLVYGVLARIGDAALERMRRWDAAAASDIIE